MLLKKLDLDSPEYKFFYCNGKVQDIPVLFGTKQPVIFIFDDMVEDEVGQKKAIDEINEFLARNPTLDDVIIAPYPVEFDFSRFLRFENLFYKEYDNILQPERISLRTIDHYVSRVFDDETVKACCEPFPLKRCKEVNDKLDLFIKDIKESDLSSFEKIMATYLICTHFIDSVHDDKIEEEYDKNIYSSVFHILGDDEDGYQIKCAGYTDMFARMLAKLDINALPLLISCSNIKFYHSVAMVDVHDEKYGIDGCYICDVRFDSDNREVIDEKVRERLTDDERVHYYTYNSLKAFCLTFQDYDYLANSDMEQMIYSTGLGVADAELLISEDRVELTDINNALMRVSLFTYLTEGNKEMSTGDDALEKIMKESSKTTAKIGSFRKKTDQFYSDLIGKEKIG